MDVEYLIIISKFSCTDASRNGRNIVECYMLRPLAHPVACCCVLLGVVVQSLKAVKLLATYKLPRILGVVGQQKLRPFARGLNCLDSEPAHIL